MSIFTEEFIKKEMTKNEINFWLWFHAELRGMSIEELKAYIKKDKRD